MVKSFGIDDMTALAGGSQSEEMAAFRPSTGPPVPKKKLPNEEPDLSVMSAAETAAMLMEKNVGKGSIVSSRHRTNKVLAHHAFAKELAEELQLRPDRKVSRLNDSEPESEEEFVDQQRTRRQRAAPQIIRCNDAVSTTKVPRKKRNANDSSSESDDSESKRRRGPARREYGSTSGSSSDEEDRRRERLRASRKRQEPQIIQTVSDTVATTKIITASTTTQKSIPNLRETISASLTSNDMSQKRGKIKNLPSSSEGESSTDESNTEHSCTSDDSSSDDEGAIAKPVFVPKEKRNMIQSEEEKWEEEEIRNERERKRTEKRKMESRALLAKTVAVVVASNMDDDVDEEGGGASNAPPNDDDDIDHEQQRDAWEVRELRRLLINMDEMKRREKEKLEYECRRQMTDEEVLLHDTKVGRYQAPGSNRHGDSTGQFMQRFYHRGAFYMAEDEWDDDDIRHKAAEYAKAVTGEDKVDKSVLPEVMQVKGFGLARQNTRYKGLAKEDTTDRRQELLPIVHKKK